VLTHTFLGWIPFHHEAVVQYHLSLTTAWNWMSVRKSNGKNYIYSASEIVEGKHRPQSITKNPKSKIQINSMNKILYVIHIDLQLNLLSHKLDKGGIKQSNLGSLQCSGTKNMMW